MAMTSENACLYIATIFFVQSTITSCANIDYLNQTLRNHFADTRNHDVDINDKDRAMQFIFKEFQRFGLDAELQNFNSMITKGCNVIGVLKGANFGKASDRILGIVAHYDTFRETKGVDDNGSGVVAILEVARQLNEENVTPEHTVIFVSSDLEEEGLVGIQHFVNDWLPSWRQRHYNDTALNKTQGFIVLDTMMEFNTTRNSQKVSPIVLPRKYFPTAINNLKSDGFKGDFLSLIYRKTPDSELADNFRHAWEAEGRPRFEIESFPLPINQVSRDSIIPPGLGDFTRSDHFIFWEANIPAIFITDTADFRGDMVQCYHNLCDNEEVMITEDNLRFLGKTADALVRTIKHNGVPTSSGNQTNHSSVTIALVLSSIIAVLRRSM